jgi:hypothetical protein
MRKKILFLFLVLPVIVFALSALLYLKSARVKHIAVIPAVSKVEKKVNSRGTEKITYDIKLYKIKLGSATLTCLPAVEVNGNLLDQIVFETELAHFKDIERIYSEPETYLPVKIERYILNWFKEERISEEYDQKNFTVTITKYKKDNKSDRLVIKKDSPMHNAILLPQQVRNVQNLEVGMLTVVNLPTRKFQIRLIAVEDVVVPAGTFRAYHFVSSPKQIEIWVSADIDRIPVKIQGIGKFGYLMVLKQYDKDKPPS